MNTRKQRQQIETQLHHHRHTDYVVDLNISPIHALPHFFVDAGVLRPDMMVSFQLAHYLSQNPHLYSEKCVLDMGCGSGIQGIITGMQGAAHVVCSDISAEAVGNTKKNVAQYTMDDRIAVVQSDLFSNIPNPQFDLIVFNHPFFPELVANRTSIGTAIMDNGDLLPRFFESAKLNKKDTRIIMPFLSMAGDLNNPAVIAPKHDYAVSTLAEYSAGHGIQKGHVRIFELRRRVGSARSFRHYER